MSATSWEAIVERRRLATRSERPWKPKVYAPSLRRDQLKALYYLKELERRPMTSSSRRLSTATSSRTAASTGSSRGGSPSSASGGRRPAGSAAGAEDGVPKASTADNARRRRPGIPFRDPAAAATTLLPLVRSGCATAVVAFASRKFGASNRC